MAGAISIATQQSKNASRENHSFEAFLMYRFNLQEGIRELDAHFLQLAAKLYYFFPF